MNANVYEEGRSADMLRPNAPMMPPPRKTRAATRGRAVLLVIGLLIVSSLPLIFGVLRLIQLAGGAEIMPPRQQFDASPLPVVVHIVSAAFYSILGAFQFPAGFRRRWPDWHRVAGRLVSGGGLLVGLSGVWMTLFYADVNGRVLLFVLRLMFGSAVVGSIALGLTTIRRGDVRQHRAWMTRGYALGLGASTQMLTLMVGEMLTGPPTEIRRALLMGTAWLINLLIAEWIIRRRFNRVPAKRAAPGT